MTASNPKTTEFWDSRFYHIGDLWLPSITTILSAYPKPGLTAWIGKVGNDAAEDVKREAGIRGSKVHDALQYNVTVYRKDYTDEEWLRLIYAKAFYSEYSPEIIMNEESVWDVDLKYAGRADKVVLMNEKVTLIDWKTGHVGRESWLQLAALKNAIEKLHPDLKIESWGIVSLKADVKDGWKYYPIEERSDVKALVKEKKATLEEAVAEAFAYDMSVFMATMAVWKDAFKAKPKYFPTPPPDKLELTIEVAERGIERRAPKPESKRRRAA